MGFKDFVNAASFSSRFNKLKEVINQPTRDRIFILTDFLEQQDIVDTYVADYLRFLCNVSKMNAYERRKVNTDFKSEKLVFPATIKITASNLPCKSEVSLLGEYKQASYPGVTSGYYLKDDEEIELLSSIYIFDQSVNGPFHFECDFYKKSTITLNRDAVICSFKIYNNSIDVFLNKLPEFIDKEKTFNYLMIQYLKQNARKVISKPEA